MEKETKIITASELLSTRKSVGINDVMSCFKGEHNTNRIEAIFIAVHISDEIKLQLFNLGFKYRTHLSSIGETCHVISLT